MKFTSSAILIALLANAASTAAEYFCKLIPRYLQKPQIQLNFLSSGHPH